MVDAEFFEEPLENSKVKSRIVAKYFSSWANVILPSVIGRNGRLGYIDLYSGPGSYEDGTDSTPLKILKDAATKPELRNRLVAMFNDKEKSNCDKLEKAIKSLPEFSQFKNPPKVYCQEVDDKITERLSSINLIPSVVFLDPWGYKGLTSDLISASLKDWACEVIFFFNYTRVNAAITNPALQSHVEKIFGKSRLQKMQSGIKQLASIQEREDLVTNELVEVLKEKRGKFVLKFKFWDEDKDKTSHFLVFVTKDVKGYEIMKDIMANESSPKADIASFEYIPSTRQMLFPPVSRHSFDSLRDDILEHFKGQSLSVQRIYEQHSVGTPFVKKNYKKVLLDLESAGKIVANPSKRRKGTMADTVTVSFPN